MSGSFLCASMVFINIAVWCGVFLVFHHKERWCNEITSRCKELMSIARQQESEIKRLRDILGTRNDEILKRGHE